MLFNGVMHGRMSVTTSVNIKFSMKVTELFYSNNLPQIITIDRIIFYLFFFKCKQEIIDHDWLNSHAHEIDTSDILVSTIAEPEPSSLPNTVVEEQIETTGRVRISLFTRE